MLIKVIATKGLPASGKSTWAKDYVYDHPDMKIARINNDDLQMAIFGKSFVDYPDMGKTLQRMRYDLFVSLAEVVDVVIIDNTNLSLNAITECRRFAEMYNAKFVIQDFTDVPIEVCLERNRLRANPVPEAVIYKMASLIGGQNA